MSRLRVMIVEDSPVVRTLLEHIIGSDPRLAVASAVATGEEALRTLAKVAPNLVTMDVRLPGMNGLDVTRRIMSERPTPIVVIAAGDASGELDLGLESVRAGAVSVIEKPRAEGPEHYEALGKRICDHLVNMSEVRLVRQRYKPARSGIVPPSRAAASAFRLIGIGASTGGPRAVVELLTGLGEAFPLPIAIVQHIGESFARGLAAWLAEVTPFAAQVVEDRVYPRPGVVYVPMPDHHLRAGSRSLYVDRGEPVCLQRPSATVLFESVAESLGGEAIGVVLTGMGTDGATGLLEMRRRGAYTIAEDESSAVVYGMPRAAAEIGAACDRLPLGAIAARIHTLIASTSKVNPCRIAATS